MLRNGSSQRKHSCNEGSCAGNAVDPVRPEVCACCCVLVPGDVVDGSSKTCACVRRHEELL